MYNNALVTEDFYYPSSDFKKSNLLINSRFKTGLLENQLIAFSLAVVKYDGEFLTAKLSAGQIKKILGKNYKDFYRQLKLAAQNLLKLAIMIENPEEKSFEGRNIVASVKSKNGDFTINFNTELKNQILDLKNNYTILSIEILSRFDKVSSFRLYETLKSRSYYPAYYNGVQDGKFRFVYTISELRCMLNGVDLNNPVIVSMFQGVENPDYDKIIATAEKIHKEDVAKGKTKKEQYPAPKWSSYGELMRQAISPAILEINEKTDLYVEANPIKQGKNHKAVAIEFYIFDKSKSRDKKDQEIEVNEKEMSVDDLIDLIDEVRDLITERISTKDIKSILSAAGNDIEKIKKAYEVSKSQEVENFTGFMISAINNDYEKPVKSSRKKSSSFSNQREYDYDELEKLLVNKY